MAFDNPEEQRIPKRTYIWYHFEIDIVKPSLRWSSVWLLLSAAFQVAILPRKLRDIDWENPPDN